MGFGLLALGYIFLNFYTTGADLIGYIIMLFAFLKLSKIEKSFKNCIIAVAILIPVGLFNLLGFVDTAFSLGMLRNYDYVVPIVSTETSDEQISSNEINSSDSSEQSVDESMIEISDEKEQARKKRINLMEGIFNALFIFGSLCFHYFFYKSIRKLCINTQCVKLGYKASRNMYINIAFFSIWGLLTAGGTNMAVLNILTMMHFVILIFNFIYIYSCYATFGYEEKSESNESIEE